ncbi:MAG: NAD(P)H-hydrate dehydratase [Myxococcales bacterium]|jgi:NAD(P)H-hydrate epimerase|nr:NAD(P)H-hydrate dehydratase [Myxococcales bacterium]
MTAFLEEDHVRALLPERSDNFHKGDAGHVLVLAGEKSGAASLTALAALRSGAGLVTIAGRERDVWEARRIAPELMGEALDSAGPLAMADVPRLLELCADKRALAVGPGLGIGPETARVLASLVAHLAFPIVLDADALNAIAQSGELETILAAARAPLVLTPHPKEMARLVQSTVRDVQADRALTARSFAERYHLTLVLKGAHTVVANAQGDLAINPTGNPGMATAGMGDALTGCIAALCAQSIDPWDAARLAVFAHGLAGDLMVQRRGRLGLIATDVIDGLCFVWRRWKR